MSRALNRMVDNVSASYSVAYTPTNTVRDGKRRRIRIQVSSAVEKREGKVVMLSRRSYIMPKAADTIEPATK
jgi:hypothetical protein